MPIPEFDEHGLLPVGVHDCTLDEVKARFGSFQATEQQVRGQRELRQGVLRVRL